MRRNVPMELDVVGYRDINHSEVIPRLTRLFRSVRRTLGWEDISLRGIYVCGSYARNEAVEVSSDLDVRYVVDRFDASEENVKLFRDTAKQIWNKEYYEDDFLFVHVDAWIGSIPPEEESVRVV